MCRLVLTSPSSHRPTLLLSTALSPFLLSPLSTSQLLLQYFFSPLLSSSIPHFPLPYPLTYLLLSFSPHTCSPLLQTQSFTLGQAPFISQTCSLLRGSLSNGRDIVGQRCSSQVSTLVSIISNLCVPLKL